MNRLSQLAFPPLTKVNKLIMMVVGGFFVLNILTALAGFSLGSILVLTRETLFSGQVWRPFTFFLYNGEPMKIIGIVFQLLILFMLGGKLEEAWGSRRHIQLFVITNLGAVIFYLLATLITGGGVAPMTGIDPYIMFITLAYALFWPDSEFHFFGIFPIKAKWICGIYIAFNLVFMLFSPLSKAYFAGTFGAMILGVAYMRLVSTAWWKRLLAKYSKDERRSRRIRKERPHLKIVSDDDDEDKFGDDDGPPKYWQ